MGKEPPASSTPDDFPVGNVRSVTEQNRTTEVQCLDHGNAKRLVLAGGDHESGIGQQPALVISCAHAHKPHDFLEIALDHFLLSRELNPRDFDLLLNLTGLFIQLKRFPEAIETSQVLIDDPTFAAPWQAFTNRGWGAPARAQARGAGELR